MAVIRRANNEKESDKRYGGNWRSETAKTLVGLAGSAGLPGLGSLGSRLYGDYNTTRSILTSPYNIYTGAVKAAQTAGLLEPEKVATKGLNYMPTLQGIFPKL